MAEPLEIMLAIVGGSGGTFVLQLATGWWKARSEDRKTERDADVKLEQHRDQLTFDLLTAAREEMAELRREVAALRPLSGCVAHLEEALDHLHALLHAEGAAAKQAAEQRARMFLRRMRPIPLAGSFRRVRRAAGRHDPQAFHNAVRNPGEGRDA